MMMWQWYLVGVCVMAAIAACVLDYGKWPDGVRASRHSKFITSWIAGLTWPLWVAWWIGCVVWLVVIVVRGLLCGGRAK